MFCKCHFLYLYSYSREKHLWTQIDVYKNDILQGTYGEDSENENVVEITFNNKYELPEKDYEITDLEILKEWETFKSKYKSSKLTQDERRNLKSFTHREKLYINCKYKCNYLWDWIHSNKYTT